MNRRRLKLRRAQRAQRGSKIKLTRIHHQGELPSLHRQETRQQLTRRDSLFRAAVPGHTARLKQPRHASANIKKTIQIPEENTEWNEVWHRQRKCSWNKKKVNGARWARIVHWLIQIIADANQALNYQIQMDIYNFFFTQNHFHF